ncbi:ABC transporter substrate-binding protein [Actinobacteria bacterium YIM 96077]|uniref:ABC transporter substrate-binding protein n=2 Tax=Phytoactinopolyspora halophila TaxID=1981511 RepID=A0A329QGW1_9ACTN|nr:ABC transporter substrate-binding protein [Actinobacteria bacterium YIM 96077]RAW11604.1 ABC transporter substrate-binding protein [Phytoactinopolyspora halophila]
MVLATGIAISLLAACGGNDDDDAADENEPAAEEDEQGNDEEGDDEGGEQDLPELPELTEVTAGYVSAVDQMGAAVAFDLALYDDLNLDVTLADPFPTGVDAIQAMEAGDVDFIQVGTPSIGAVLEDVDLVYLGNYTGSSTQLGIDETMAMVAAQDSGIESDDLSTLEGKSIGVSIGSINHLYLLGVLEEAGLTPDDVQIENTSPPDMGVALETEGLDAAVVWDPWPITISNSVEGASEVIRGGGYIPFIGYIIATRDFVEENPDVVKAFLTARAAADQWMRENPDEAADVVTRWIPDTEIEVAEEAMQYNIEQLDPRFSACNYVALDTMQGLLEDVDAIEDTFDVNDHFEPQYILEVMEEQPQLFDDLPEIPEEAEITADYTFDRAEAVEACPEN